MTLAPDEQAWLDVYRHNPEIRHAVLGRLTGQIAVNLSEGALLTADVKVHVKLRAAPAVAPKSLDR